MPTPRRWPGPGSGWKRVPQARLALAQKRHARRIVAVPKRAARRPRTPPCAGSSTGEVMPEQRRQHPHPWDRRRHIRGLVPRQPRALSVEERRLPVPGKQSSLPANEHRVICGGRREKRHRPPIAVAGEFRAALHNAPARSSIAQPAARSLASPTASTQRRQEDAEDQARGPGTGAPTRMGPPGKADHQAGVGCPRGAVVRTSVPSLAVHRLYPKCGLEIRRARRRPRSRPCGPSDPRAADRS